MRKARFPLENRALGAPMAPVSVVAGTRFTRYLRGPLEVHRSLAAGFAALQSSYCCLFRAVA